MLHSNITLPTTLAHELRYVLRAIIREACSIEQKNFEDDTALATLANGGSYAFSHSKNARYRRIVQVYEGTNRELVTSGLTVQLTDDETTTIVNNSGSVWTDVYINILLY